ncbi:unnamed protein product [Pylaiella littoralis]
MKVLAPRLALHGYVLPLVSLVASTLAAGAALSFTEIVVSQEASLIPAFDESFARDVVKLTEAAYCTAELVGWNCTVCRSFPGMRNVTTLQGKSRNVRGFIGIDVGGGGGGGTGTVTATSTSKTARRRRVRSPEQGNTAAAAAAAAAAVAAVAAGREGMKAEAILGASGSGSGPRPRIVVTFSGTDPKSMKNWIDDLEAAPIAHAYEGGGCDDCKVHRGFLAAYDVVQDQIRGAVAQHLRHHPNAEILITGHSLGGALATLCFLDLQLTLGLGVGPKAVSFAPLYIFGSPRVGNEMFARFSVSHGVPIFRVVHNHDPVPHLPFEVWGYRHPPTEIFFDANQTSFVVCNDTGEDLSCSDQFWVISGALHISDHLSYLGVEYTQAYLQCFISEKEGGEEDESPPASVLPAIPAATTTAMIA